MDKELEEARQAFDLAGRAWVDADLNDDGEEREALFTALTRLHRATLDVVFTQAESEVLS